jgi:hypothetical protein
VALLVPARGQVELNSELVQEGRSFFSIWLVVLMLPFFDGPCLIL